MANDRKIWKNIACKLVCTKPMPELESKSFIYMSLNDWLTLRHKKLKTFLNICTIYSIT